MANETKIGWKVLIGFIAIIIAICVSMPVAASSGEAQAADALVGAWACQSIYGGPYTGRSCQTFPWLKLNADKKRAEGHFPYFYYTFHYNDI